MASREKRASRDKTIPIVGIGTSAGGLEALTKLFSALPDAPGAAFIVAMHLAPDHHSELASILARHTGMDVTEVDRSEQLALNHVYVMPPDRRLAFSDGKVTALPFEGATERRTAMDLLFRSLAEHRANAFAVILSGGGSDGSVGAKAVKEQAGVVLVQEPAEAAFDSMPRAAIAAGIADLVLPVRELAARLVDLIQGRDSIEKDLAETPRLQADDDAMLGHIIRYVNVRTGHDFSRYKHGTLLRRVVRRMQIHGLATLGDYLAYIKKTPDEPQGLLQELLISVTTFFRDAPAWEALARQVVPRLFDAKGPEEPLRVWVAGCATGEEAYSLAMLLLEEAARRTRPAEVQLFATDLDERALAVARDGCYAAAIEADVSAERLGRFFVREEDHYRVGRELRDTALFARHSLLRDPPFARQDLISCRNLLIYMDRELQERVFAILRYALQPGGFLFLGVSEHADGECFRTFDKKHHVYQARELTGGALSLLPDMLAPAPMTPHASVEPWTAKRKSLNVPKTHRALLEDLAPPSILVDDRRHTVHLSETAGRYLQPPAGPPTHDVTLLVRPELQAELAAALYAVFDKGEASLSEFIPVQFNGTPRSVAMVVQPRQGRDGEERLALVMFLEAGDAAPVEPEPGDTDATATLVRRLKDELTGTRNRLRTSREEFEAANEELRAANEELQSLNEEYRSTAEELETSKEELQSINEELQTVNSELKNKLEEVSHARRDLENLMVATEIPTLFLDRELRIQRFTPQVTKLFSIKASDRDRPISDLNRCVRYDALEADAARVLQDLTPVEREVQTDDGRWYLARLRPYRGAGHRIDGVVATFIDFTAQKDAEKVVREERHYAESIVETIREPVVILTDDLHVESANTAFYETFAVDADATRNRLIYELGNNQWDIPELRRLLEEVLPNDKTFDGFLVSHDFEQIGPRIMLLNGRRLDSLQRVLLAIEDITEHEQALQALREADRQKNRFLSLLGHELRNPLAAISNTVTVLKMGAARDDGARDALGVIERQVRHLVRLVDDLLNLSRISRGQFELQTALLDLADCIRDAVVQARPSIEANAQRLELDLPEQPLRVHGDRERLTQILTNLLVNAARYTDDNGRIDVAAERAGGRVMVRVRDTGIGIAAEDLPRLFEPFTRLDAAMHRHEGGLGLGLTLARQLAQLHDGTLEAHSDGPGRGSEFTLSLPLRNAVETEQLEAAPAPATGTIAARRILIAEDDPAVGESLAMLLEGLGQEVRLVSRGSEVEAAVEAFRPVLVILDINLPEVSGDELARRLRGSHGPDALQIVALSGFSQETAEPSDLESFDRYLLKPAALDRIKALLTESLGG